MGIEQRTQSKDNPTKIVKFIWQMRGGRKEEHPHMHRWWKEQQHPQQQYQHQNRGLVIELNLNQKQRREELKKNKIFFKGNAQVCMCVFEDGDSLRFLFFFCSICCSLFILIRQKERKKTLCDLSDYKMCTLNSIHFTLVCDIAPVGYEQTILIRRFFRHFLAIRHIFRDSILCEKVSQQEKNDIYSCILASVLCLVYVYIKCIFVYAMVWFYRQIRLS